MKPNSKYSLALTAAKWCVIAVILFGGVWLDLLYLTYYPEWLFWGYILVAPILVMLLTGQLQGFLGSEKELGAFEPKYVWLLKAAFLLISIGIMIFLYRISAYMVVSDDWFVYFLDSDSIKFFFPPLRVKMFDDDWSSLWRFMDWSTCATIVLPALLWLWDVFRGIKRKKTFTLSYSFLYSGFIAGTVSFRLFMSCIDFDDVYGLMKFSVANSVGIPKAMLFIAVGAICTIPLYVFLLRHMKKRGQKTSRAKRLVLPVLSLGLIVMCVILLTAFRTEIILSETDPFGISEPEPIPEFVDNTPIKAIPLASPPEFTHKKAPNEYEYYVDVERYTETEAAAFMRKINDYAFRSSALALADIAETDNAIYSPTTSFVGLSMLAACTEDDVRNEILDCLGLDSLTDTLDSDINELLQNLYADDEIGRQILANAFWMDEKITGYIDEDMIESLAQNYQAAVYQTDFDSLDAQADLDTWIRKATKGMVNSMEIPPRTKLMLGTALFVDGGWNNIFNPYKNQIDKFTTSNGDKVDCEFMFQGSAYHNFIVTDKLSASYLTFGHGAAMHFILPNEGVSVYELLKSPGELAKAIDYASEHRNIGSVDFKVPKLEFSSELEMDSVAKKMGIKRLFEHASVAGIDGNIIEDIVIKQSNAISMDEYGVRAASVSMSSIVIMGILDHLTLKLDRPFLFVITGREGYVLFTGFVNNPSM